MKILCLINIAFRGNFKGATEETIRQQIDLWHEAFEYEKYSSIELAVKEYILTEKTGIVPTIGIITNIIRDIFDKQIPQDGLPEEPEPHKPKRWERVAAGETFYYISPKGMVIARKDNGASHNGYYNCGNYYHTQAEAEYYRDKRQLETDIRRWKWEHDSGTLDCDDNEKYKFRITYDYKHEELLNEVSVTWINFFSIFFSTLELTRKCIAVFGDRIKEIIERGCEFND